MNFILVFFGWQLQNKIWALLTHFGKKTTTTRTTTSSNKKKKGRSWIKGQARFAYFNNELVKTKLTCFKNCWLSYIKLKGVENCLL